MTDIGYYSVVQYVADPVRGEAVNVGALLEVAGEIHIRFVGRPLLNGASETVTRFEQTLHQLVDDNSLSDVEEPGRDGLDALALRRFPHFAFTTPRPVALSDSPERVLNELALRIVDEPASHAV